MILMPTRNPSLCPRPAGPTYKGLKGAYRPTLGLPFFARSHQGKADSPIGPATRATIGPALITPRAPAGYLAELRARLLAFAAALRLRRAHGDQLEAEVCLDVVADAAAQQARAGDHAYTAQQAALEAERHFRAAQLPDSPGGAAITPAEATTAFRHLRQTHRHTAAVCSLLAS